MRNGKYYIKISFRLRFFVGEWQVGLLFSERHSPVKIVFLLLNEDLFWILLCRIISDLPRYLDDWDGCNVHRNRPLPTVPSYFTQGNSFCNWFWKTMGEVDLDFKWAISPDNLFSPSKIVSDGIKFHLSCPPSNAFQKLCKPPQCLIWAVNHKFALRFYSVRSRATAIFN